MVKYIRASETVTDKYMAHSYSTMTGIENWFIADSRELAQKCLNRFKNLISDYSDDYGVHCDEFEKWMSNNHILMKCSEDGGFTKVDNGLLYADKIYEINLVGEFVGRF